MKTFHYITKDGEGWIKADNQYPQYNSFSTFTGSAENKYVNPEWAAFDKSNPDIKWVGDKLPEGTVLREEEITFEFLDENGVWLRIEWPYYPNIEVRSRFKDKSKSSIPTCTTCNKFTIRENSDNITVCNGCELPVKSCNCEKYWSQLTQREGEPEYYILKDGDQILVGDQWSSDFGETWGTVLTDFEETFDSSVHHKHRRVINREQRESEQIQITPQGYSYDDDEVAPVSSQPVTEPVKVEEAYTLTDIERSFCFGYLANPENNPLDNIELNRKWNNYKTYYLNPDNHAKD